MRPDRATLPTHATYAIERSRVLELGTLATPRSRVDVTVRAYESDRDREAAVALDAAGRDAAADRVQDAFHRWRIGVDRASVRAGRTRVLGAFDRDNLLGFAGLHERDAWLRVMTPKTAIAVRGRGIFTRLFADLYRSARRRHPNARCIVVAEPDGAPERLYRSLGFVAIGTQSALVRPVAPIA